MKMQNFEQTTPSDTPYLWVYSGEGEESEEIKKERKRKGFIWRRIARSWCDIQRKMV
jgi:histidinol-phosphate/aromatic aminotransferase/cobyric acid decarboxylase-like protein